MPNFIPGLELNARFYTEVIRPCIGQSFPDLRYSAALIGEGSEVLGYDTEQSTDHCWGPRIMLFLSEAHYDSQKDNLLQKLHENVSTVFRICNKL